MKKKNFYWRNDTKIQFNLFILFFFKLASFNFWKRWCWYNQQSVSSNPIACFIADCVKFFNWFFAKLFNILIAHVNLHFGRNIDGNIYVLIRFVWVINSTSIFKYRVHPHLLLHIFVAEKIARKSKWCVQNQPWKFVFYFSSWFQIE